MYSIECPDTETESNDDHSGSTHEDDVNPTELTEDDDAGLVPEAENDVSGDSDAKEPIFPGARPTRQAVVAEREKIRKMAYNPSED